MTDADVLICGEPGEWDAGEYVRDTVASGKKKGMIVVGHYMSEEGGMAECARWVKTFITEVPVEFLPGRGTAAARSLGSQSHCQPIRPRS